MSTDIKKEFTSPQLYLIALVLGIIAIMMIKFSYSLTPIAVILGDSSGSDNGFHIPVHRSCL